MHKMVFTVSLPIDIITLLLLSIIKCLSQEPLKCIKIANLVSL
jgi:hypothetical protein